MGGALVIGGSALDRFAVKQRLGDAGFSRVVLAHDPIELWSMQGRFDLVIVLRGTDALNQAALMGMAARFDAPLLVARDDPLAAIERVCQHPPALLRRPEPAQPLRLAA